MKNYSLPNPEFFDLFYHQAKALDKMALIVDEQHARSKSCGQVDEAILYAKIRDRLMASARDIFPLSPHPEFSHNEVQKWLQENGLAR